MQNIIETDRLSVSYGSQKVLDNISYGFKKNKITAILGSSGCGKTTLLHALNNLLSEEENIKISGDVRLEQTSIYTMPNESLLSGTYYTYIQQVTANIHLRPIYK